MNVLKPKKIWIYRFAGFPVLVLGMGAVVVAKMLGLDEAVDPLWWNVLTIATGVLAGLADSILYNVAIGGKP